jgi:hypothetical protein
VTKTVPFEQVAVSDVTYKGLTKDRENSVLTPLSAKKSVSEIGSGNNL